MRAARLAILVFVLLATLVASAPAKQPAAPGAPTALRGFLLRPNESVTHTFSRTPAFAWNPVRGAACYEFELGTSRTFEDSTVVWSNVSTGRNSGRGCRSVTKTLTTVGSADSGDVSLSTKKTNTIKPIRIPAVTLSVTLPWATGQPYALYAQVRAVTTRGATRWSRPFGFNMRWEELPVPLASKPGLVRWTPVEGATSYEVWYPDIRKGLATSTNVADEREFYTFHFDDGWWSTVRWRVRAIREVLGSVDNGLPAVSYGPWSPVYATTNPSWAAGKLQVKSAVSDVVSSSWRDASHQLMPALTFSGDLGLDTREYRLFRVYAFTDKDCVNVVFRGSVVGGPAFAPRTSGPLKLPTTEEEVDLALSGVLPSAKNETAKTLTSEGADITSAESQGESQGEGASATGVHIDLPDVDAKSTRYFWTVVPVAITISDAGTLGYADVESPQDACEAGRTATFGKLSRPVITASGAPYVSGLTPRGRLLTVAKGHPVVYSTPLVAWRPVIAANAYSLEWSRTKYPWRAAGELITRSTSAVLNLRPGNWFYRVRGLNPSQVGTSAMTWSAPVAITVARPTFRVSSR
jgi:hypothetical protein